MSTGNKSQADHARDSRIKLFQLIGGNALTAIVYSACKLELADHLAKMPGQRATAEELAPKCQAHAPSLYRLLRALASLGLFVEDDQHRFGFTPMAEYLRQDKSDSLWPVAMMNGEEHYLVWSRLADSVRTGRTMFEEVCGAPVFEFLSQHPEKGKIFDAAMTAYHGQETVPMLAAYDFSGVRTLCDIGGGNGSLLIAALKANPHLQGILYDLAPVIERARSNIEAAGMASRAKAVAGSFFESVTPGADAYLTRHIIHDWDDDQCRTILKNVHQVIPADGRLLVIDTVIPKGNDPWFGKLLDLTMLLMPGGRERTEEEFRELFSSAKFELTRIIPVASEMSIIEGRKR